MIDCPKVRRAVVFVAVAVGLLCGGCKTHGLTRQARVVKIYRVNERTGSRKDGLIGLVLAHSSTRRQKL
eukprot:1152243-Pelagomonas_calceolata.AAC.1